jgi:DNA-binding MarR family transcriptional regulator
MAARVSYLIKRVERGVRAELDEVLRSLKVTTPEYTAMSVLGRRGGLSSAQLARRSFVSAQAMNQIVAALERNGWLERTVDPDHGRILRAKLTHRGEAVLKACDDATARVERALLAKLSRQEANLLRQLLESCVASLGQPEDT